ncbi:MAG: hypothetical protein IJF42_08330 [Clostridia bacterium]|nr:hypothetical protein [Clostridia bacterium]
MTVGELMAAAATLPATASVNLLVPTDGGEEWREAQEARPDRELVGLCWHDSLTVVVGSEVC